jgi:radical SAM protein with 4Fe4S-binding SPASM domain
MSVASSTTERPLLREVMSKSAQCNIPLQVGLELTYRCNLRCSHCYVDIVEKDELSLDEWRDVLEQLKEAGTLYLLLTCGEILVRPDFLEIAMYARQRGFFIGLLTNCTLVTPSIAQAIAELKPYSLGTSLYGDTATSHELVTGIPGSFQKTLEGIKQLVSVGVTPTVQVIVMKSNIDNLQQIEKLIESLGARANIKTGMAPSKTGDEFPFLLEPTAEELMECGRQQDHPQPDDEQPQLCKAGKGICSISPRGDIFPCVMFPMKLGNIRQSSFDSIWRLEPCAELRYLRLMRRSDLYACVECEVKEYCHRCAGTAYLESGRIDGPSPSACRQAHMRLRLSKNKGV